MLEKVYEIVLILPAVEDFIVGVLVAIVAVAYNLYHAFQQALEIRHLVQWEGIKCHVFCDVYYSFHHDLQGV